MLARATGTRVSTACFFYPSTGQMMRAYGPIEELVNEDNPAVYRQVPYLEFVTHYQKKNVRGGPSSALPNFKVINKD